MEMETFSTETVGRGSEAGNGGASKVGIGGGGGPPAENMSENEAHKTEKLKRNDPSNL